MDTLIYRWRWAILMLSIDGAELLSLLRSNFGFLVWVFSRKSLTLGDGGPIYPRDLTTLSTSLEYSQKWRSKIPQFTGTLRIDRRTADAPDEFEVW